MSPLNGAKPTLFTTTPVSAGPFFVASPCGSTYNFPFRVLAKNERKYLALEHFSIRTRCDHSGSYRRCGCAIALHNHHSALLARVGLYLAGGVLLTLYGTSLNLAPVEFAAVTGMYVATLFVVFQITNYVFFRTLPTPAVLVGGSLIVAGGLIVSLWK